LAKNFFLTENLGNPENHENSCSDILPLQWIIKFFLIKKLTYSLNNAIFNCLVLQNYVRSKKYFQNPGGGT